MHILKFVESINMNHCSPPLSKREVVNSFGYNYLQYFLGVMDFSILTHTELTPDTTNNIIPPEEKAENINGKVDVKKKFIFMRHGIKTSKSERREAAKKEAIQMKKNIRSNKIYKSFPALFKKKVLITYKSIASYTHMDKRTVARYMKEYPFLKDEKKKVNLKLKRQNLKER